MPKNHLKSMSAPKTWPIFRKHSKFVTRPNPGAHSLDLSVPMTLVMKDLLKIAKTIKEVRKIIRDQEVLVNGKRRKDHRHLVGLLDVIAFPKANEYYVILINRQNKLYTMPITKSEAETKLSKVMNKSTIKGGLVQLQTLDGRTIRVKKDSYKTGNTLLLSMPSQDVKEVFRLEKGTPVLLYRGRHVGKTGTVVEVQGEDLIFKAGSEEFQTKRSFALSIGKDKPIIKIK